MGIPAEPFPRSVRLSFVDKPIDDSVRRLEAELTDTLQGEIRFDKGTRALYATDASNYRQVPVGVVVPRTVEDVVATVAACRAHDAAVLPRGCGTSLSGETCNAAVVIDFSQNLDHVLALDPEARTARVEPGRILDTLRAAAEVHHLTFGPDPATHDHCTLGGMIGNNSGGVHALMAGLTVRNVRALEVLTYDGLRLWLGGTSPDELASLCREKGRRGEIYRGLVALRDRYEDEIRRRYPQIPRRVSGYENLDQLFDENGFNVAKALVGTEGTCVTILQAELDLVPSPREHAIAILGFEDVFAAADAVPEVLRHGPMGLEGMDHLLADYIRKQHLHEAALDLLPEGKGWLIAQFGGKTREEAAGKARRLVDAMHREGVTGKELDTNERRQKIWAVREAALAATAWVPDQPDTWPVWEDSAVHRDNLGDYLRALKALFHKCGYEASIYGHFGDGLVHCRIDFDLRDRRGIETWRRFLDEAADLVVRFGGSLSGEHGDGEARAALIEKMYGRDLVQCFREFKAIWDPESRMNPGKVVDPYPITANLRVGPDYQPPAYRTNFAFRRDQGSFARAAMRCVGVGKCRRVAATAISAVDTALWDLKARLLDVPLARLLGRARESVPIYGSGGFTTYDHARLAGQLSAWVEEDGCR
jgi:FAD/FMN-containing dehydrogenase